MPKYSANNFERTIAYGSLCLMAVACSVLIQIMMSQAASRDDTLVIYCAAGVRQPVEQLAAAYTETFGTQVQVEYGSSGELEGKLVLDQQNNKHRADIYIPADTSFADRAAKKGLTETSFPLARFRLVLAVAPDIEVAPEDLDTFLASPISFAICDPTAGVGKKTAEVLKDRYSAIASAAKVTFPSVTEAASAVASSQELNAAFIWDTTAIEFNLHIVELPELSSSYSQISANIVANSQRPTAARQFCQYLVAPKNGRQAFEQAGFQGLPATEAPK